MSEPESFAPGICRTGICLALLRKIQQQNAAEDKIKKELATLTDVSSTRIEGSFFSVAMTTPLAAAKIDIFRIIKEGKRKVKGLYYLTSIHIYKVEQNGIIHT